jgi:hypothetical protein
LNRSLGFSGARPARRNGDRPGKKSPRKGSGSLFGIIFALIISTCISAAMANSASYDVAGAFVVTPILLIVSLPLLRRLAQNEADPRMRRLLAIALIMKLFGAIVRYAVIFEVYAGSSDAAGYHDDGVKLAEQFRHGNFTVDVGKVVGTGFMRILTGVVYTIIGPTQVGGFIFFSWLGFWGLYFFYRAFVIGLPTGDHRRYALLVFFMPSLLFWPSSIGKEAWMMLCLGIATYGAARVLRGMHGGYLIAATGLLGATMVRPHVSVVFMAGFMAAYFLRRTPGRQSALGPIAKVIGIVVLIAASSVVLRQSEEFLKVDSLNSQAATQVRQDIQKNTTQGGSQFDTAKKGGLSSLPWAAVTLVFRPFPWETRSAQALFASLEGALLILLFIRARKRLKRIIRVGFENPYVVFAVVYSLVFIYAFSVVGNFGIVSRQRVQLYPYIFVLLALPPVAGEVKKRRGSKRARPARGRRARKMTLRV